MISGTSNYFLSKGQKVGEANRYWFSWRSTEGEKRNWMLPVTLESGNIFGNSYVAHVYMDKVGERGITCPSTLLFSKNRNRERNRTDANGP